MESLKLKKNIHSLIDKVEDTNLLLKLNNVLTNCLKGEEVSWNSLSEKEEKSIETGLSQLEKGEGIDYEKVSESLDEWTKR